MISIFHKIFIICSMAYTNYMENKLKWNTQMSKGFFEITILMLTYHQPCYGYELRKRLGTPTI